MKRAQCHNSRTDPSQGGRDAPPYVSRGGCAAQRREFSSREAMSSNGTPRVSGTVSFTQRSWRTIMPQKKRKIQPGGRAVTIFGKIVVRSAAKNQCVKLPRD